MDLFWAPMLQTLIQPVAFVRGTFVSTRAGDGPGAQALCKVEDEFERVLDSMHLVEGEMPCVFAEGASIDCPDHLAHNTRCLVVDRDLWMKGRRRC